MIRQPRPDELTSWLLATDPALRWQVERDLVGTPEETWRATRARVPHEGFGARLLQLQDPAGTWAGGAFFPSGWEEPEEGPRPPQPWTATTWTLNSLREWGVDASALGDTADRLARNARWEYDDLPYWAGEVDCCINAWTLANGTWLGADVSGLERWFAEHQMADGGWNCAWEWYGATVSSVESTLNVLVSLRYREERGVGDLDLLRSLRRGGEDYLLERGLMRRRSTREPIGDFVTEFAYPGRARYSVLRALDHFRAVDRLDEAAGRPVDGPDPRLAEAVEAVRAKRTDDGRWLQDVRLGGEVWFEVDVPPGEASPWLTLSALRVLDWWDRAQRT